MQKRIVVMMCYENALITAGLDATVRFWNVKTGELIGKEIVLEEKQEEPAKPLGEVVDYVFAQMMDEHSSAVNAIALWDGKLFTASTDKSLRIYARKVRCIPVYQSSLSSPKIFGLGRENLVDRNA